MNMQLSNTLWIAVFVFLSVGAFAQQEECKEKVTDLKASDIQTQDTIRAKPLDSKAWVDKVMTIYRPGEKYIEKKEWVGDLKVYYYRENDCLLIHRTEQYVKHTVTAERLTVLPDKNFTPIQETQEAEQPEQKPEKPEIPTVSLSEPVSKNLLITVFGAGPAGIFAFGLAALFRKQVSSLWNQIRFKLLARLAAKKIERCSCPQELKDCFITYFARAAKINLGSNTVKVIKDCSEALGILPDEPAELVRRLEDEQYNLRSDMKELRKETARVLKKCI